MASRRTTRKQPARSNKASKASKVSKAAKTAKTAKAAKAARRAPQPKAQREQTLLGLPMLWAHEGKGQAVGIHVDDDEVWAGWESGDVVACDHQGAILRRWKLPAGVDSLVADDAWRYAGCRDGNIYDLTGRQPRVAYQVDASAHVQWIDIYRGRLCASDSNGACTVVDMEQNPIWKHAPKRAAAGWMVRTDATGVYLGNSQGVSKLAWSDGSVLWKTTTPPVGFGWEEADHVFAFVGYNVVKPQVVALDKGGGKITARGLCFSASPHYDPPNNAASCATSPGGARMFGGTRGMLFCFDERGALLWETPTHIGSTCSMVFHADRLYVVTHKGTFACLDVSDAAVAAARTAAPKRARAAALSAVAVTTRDVEDTKDAGAGVIVECVEEGGKLRVRVVSPGYDASWYCQFPRDIREEGARYVVDGVREAAQGGFYRVIGDIRRLRS